MKNGDRFCIKLFGISILKIKKISDGFFDIYIFGLPFLYYRKTGLKFELNILILRKIIEHYKKASKKRQIKKARLSIIKKFKKGEKLNICIQVCRPGLWNYDYLYKILKNSPYFNPSILIMPDKNYKREMHKLYFDQCYDELVQMGYTPFKGFDFESNKLLNIRKEINPDIILYTDFWKPHFFNSFYITSFLDKITFLNEYGFSVMQDELTCNFELNNLVDGYFRPTSIHLEMSKKIMNNQGKNVKITGTPKLDSILDKNRKFNDIWKPQEKQKKRVIWAPHYNSKTSARMYQNDGFWYLYDYMLELATKFKDEIQFVFRPHPVLYQALEKEWGLEKTQEYYQAWDDLENGQYFNGDFADLFTTSDAMIMDCCSFMAEYTAFNKPLFHTVTHTSRTNLNEFGKILYKNFYVPKNDLKEDIENFIQDVVINGNDYKKDQRTQFVQQHFGKINGKTASENIYDEIIKFLEEGKV